MAQTAKQCAEKVQIKTQRDWRHKKLGKNITQQRQ